MKRNLSNSMLNEWTHSVVYGNLLSLFYANTRDKTGKTKFLFPEESRVQSNQDGLFPL